MWSIRELTFFLSREGSGRGGRGEKNWKLPPRANFQFSFLGSTDNPWRFLGVHNVIPGSPQCFTRSPHNVFSGVPPTFSEGIRNACPEGGCKGLPCIRFKVFRGLLGPGVNIRDQPRQFSGRFATGFHCCPDKFPSTTPFGPPGR